MPKKPHGPHLDIGTFLSGLDTDAKPDSNHKIFDPFALKNNETVCLAFRVMREYAKTAKMAEIPQPVEISTNIKQSSTVFTFKKDLNPTKFDKTVETLGLDDGNVGIKDNVMYVNPRKDKK